MRSDQDQKRMEIHGDLLPRDVVLEILIRLPKKSLARFSCISREWEHMLSHQSFYDMRINYKRRRRPKWILRNRLLLLNGPKVRDCWELRCQMTDAEEGTLIKEFTLPPYHRDDGAGGYPCPSNDLLFYFSYKDRKPYLYNIKTDRIQQLPEASGHNTDFYFTYGFGYSSKSDEYKVVHLYCTEMNADPIMNCEVYSTRTDSWTISDKKCPCSWVEERGVAAHNMIHWKPGRNSYAGDVKFSVVSFDLNEEKFTTMPFSRECEFSDIYYSELYIGGYLAELKDRLCLVHHPDMCEKDMRLRVLALKDYSEGTWEYWCNISLDFMNSEPFSGLFTIFRVAYVGNQELAFVTRFGRDDEREVYCDMRESLVTRIEREAYGTIIIYGKSRKV